MNDVARLRRFLHRALCMSPGGWGPNGEPLPCTDDHGHGHIWNTRAKGLLADPDRAAETVHGWVCPAEVDTQTFPSGCGLDRERHIVWVAEQMAPYMPGGAS